MRLLQIVAAVQGGYYVLTGVWSLVSIRTFQWVTGPKTDLWLVKTVGVLVIVIGAALGLAAWRDDFSPEVVLLGIGSALVLTAIELWYVRKRVISRIYLLDAVLEVGLVVAWLVAL